MDRSFYFQVNGGLVERMRIEKLREAEKEIG